MREAELPTPEGSLRLALLLVGAFAKLVPGDRRREWREQWQADLWVYWLQLHRAERWCAAADRDLLRRSIGALRHGMWLRRRQWSIDMFNHELRFGVRMLVKKPMFTLTSAAILGIGIGANTTIFSWLEMMVLDPLPQVVEPGRLVAIPGTTPTRDGLSLSYPNFADLRERRPPELEGVLAQRLVPMNLRTSGEPQRVWGGLVTGEFFEVLGVRPVLGRAFLPEEDATPDSHPVAVVGHRLWQLELGGDADIIGSEIELNGRSFTVIGVAPEHFRGGMSGIAIDLYVPMMMQRAVLPGDRLNQRGNAWMQVLGRLSEGAGLEQAQAALDVIAAQLQDEFPDVNENRGMRGYMLWKAPESASARVLPVFSVLMGLVGVVLLIACVNVASLLLSRAAGREREVAVRVAVGASRSRLVRQLLVESLLLAVLGGVAGFLMAIWTSRALGAMMPPTRLPIVLEPALDLRVLAFTAAIAIATGVIFGLAPALQASHPDLVGALKAAAGGSVGLRRTRLRSLLVTGQVALSVVLLVSAGLFLRTLDNSRDIDTGFAARQGLFAAIDLLPGGYGADRGVPFFRELLDRIEAVPGVRVASLGEDVPLGMSGCCSDTNAEIEGYQPSPGEEIVLHYNRVGPGYFDTMGIPITGREFTDSDVEDAPCVVAVNATMAERYWAGEALGRRLRLGSNWCEVVGVAKNGKYGRLTEMPLNMMYLPVYQFYKPDTTLHVATSVDARVVLPQIRHAVRELDASLPLFEVRTIAEHLDLSVYLQSMTATLLAAFGLMAVALASVGIYGLVAQAVAQRTREIGVRMALGASRADVLRLVVGRGMRMTLFGVAAGLVMAVTVARLFASQLVGVTPTDYSVLGAGSLALTTVALLASYLPARRGASVDPAEALHYD